MHGRPARSWGADTTSHVVVGLDAGTNYDFRVKALNPGGAATSSTVSEATLTDFEQRKQDNHIAPGGDENTDTDSDGMSDAQEYAFGTDPKSGASAQPVTGIPAPSTGTITYTRRKPTLTGLSFTVWTSTNLTDWTKDTGAGQSVTATSGDVETVEVTLTGSLVENDRLFIQVRAE